MTRTSYYLRHSVTLTLSSHHRRADDDQVEQSDDTHERVDISEHYYVETKAVACLDLRVGLGITARSDRIPTSDGEIQRLACSPAENVPFTGQTLAGVLPYIIKRPYREAGGEILAEMRTTAQTLRSSQCEPPHGPAGAIACPPRVK